ncbi:MAG: hypothetical protein WDM76_15215 [Limisphaerales bacterium]
MADIPSINPGTPWWRFSAQKRNRQGSAQKRNRPHHFTAETDGCAYD